MIEVQHLTKKYGERVAVNDLSFAVKKGEVIGFLGPNGAGKSTTLRMLTGYLVPTAGTITIGGVSAIHDPIEARRSIGYLPESVPLYLELRVDEYLRYRARLKGVPRSQVKARVDTAIGLANIGDVRSRIIGQLSKGYRSRVGIADAVVADPPVLILDEPTAGLDPNQIRQVRDLIRGMAGSKTVLLSTHILPEVESTCGRVLIINKGVVVGEGAPGELRVKKRGGQVLIVEGRAEKGAFEEVLRAAPGVHALIDCAASGVDSHPPLLTARLEVENADVAEAVSAALAKAGIALRELRREQTSLEDVFASLTTKDTVFDAELGADVPQPSAADPGASP